MNTNELENKNVNKSISKKIMTFLFPLHVEDGFVCIWYEKCISLKAPGLPKGARGGRNQSASSPVPIAQRHHRSGSPLFFSLSGSGVHAFRSRLEVLICACEVAPPLNVTVNRGLRSLFSLLGSGVHAFRSRLEVLICACEVASPLNVTATSRR